MVTILDFKTARGKKSARNKIYKWSKKKSTHNNICTSDKKQSKMKKTDCINLIKLDAVTVCTCARTHNHGNTTRAHISLWDHIICCKVTCFIFSIICQVTKSEAPTAGHFTAGTNRGQSFAPEPITSAEHTYCMSCRPQYILSVHHARANTHMLLLHWDCSRLLNQAEAGHLYCHT